MAFLNETGLEQVWSKIKTKVSSIENTIDDINEAKVDKVDGKGLSTEDYTTAEKEKLAGVAAGATKVIVDNALSNTSTNAIQNKVVANMKSDIDDALSAKLDTITTSGDGNIITDISKSGTTINAEKNAFATTVKEGNPVSETGVAGAGFSVKTTFEPIQAGSGDPSPDNIRTISGWTGAKLTRCGINLADFAFVGNTLNNNGMSGTFDNDGLVISGTPAYDYAHILVADNIKLQNGTYFVSGGDVTKVYLQVGIIDAIGNTTFYVNDKFTIKGNEQTVSFSIQAGLKSNTGTLSNYRLQPMIICGSSAPTAYEPYHGNTYTADFGQTVYGGTLDWQTGVLTVDRALYTFDGSENFVNGGWSNPYSYVRWDFFPDVVKYHMSVVADAYCSHYAVGSVGYVITNQIAGFGIYDRGHLIFSSPTHADVDAFKSYLAAQYAAGTPVQVCYKLATPHTIQLTPQDLRMLDGINTVYSDGNTNYVIFNSGASSLAQVDKNYLKLSGGTINGSIAVVSEGFRITELAGSSISLRQTIPDSPWATGLSLMSSNNSKELGCYGFIKNAGDSLGYYYIGDKYDAPQFKMAPDGTITLAKALPVASGGTGTTNAENACNMFLNSLSTGSSTPEDNDYYISQYVGGGTTTTSFHRRPVSNLYNYIKAKTDTLYPSKTGDGASGTWGINISGNAATATKLATPRSIYIGQIGIPFDGSKDIGYALSDIMGRARCRGSQDSYVSKYTKFARVNISNGPYDGVMGIFNFVPAEGNSFNGLLGYHIRNGSTISTTSIELEWLTTNSANCAETVYAVKVQDGIFDLYYKSLYAWDTMTITNINATPENKITFYSNQGYVDSINAVAVSSLSGQVSYALTATNATYALKMQTYKQGSTTETYGTSYPLYAQWESSNVLKLKCDNFTVKTDTATQLATARTIQTNLGSTSSASFNGTENITPGVTGTLAVGNGGTGATTRESACNLFLNALSTGSATPTDNDYYISQYAGGGNTTTTYHRRPIGALYNYITGKADTRYAMKDHTHSYLPLSGGTITGDFIVKNAATWPNIKIRTSTYNAEEGIIFYAQPASSTNSYFGFREYSRSSSSYAPTSYYEEFVLPTSTGGRTSNASYNILTSKYTISVAQGGTGSTSKSGARTNLGIVSGTSLPSASGYAAGDIFILY